MSKRFFFSIILFFYSCGFGISQSSSTVLNDDTLKYYDYSKGKKPDMAGTGNYLILTDPNTGKVIFDERNGKPDMELYTKFSDMGDALYLEKKFSMASMAYEKALKVNFNQGKVKHRLNLARCYCELDLKDSAFAQLKRVAFYSNYYDYKALENDSVFKILKGDIRWKEIIGKVQENAIKIKGELDRYIPQN